MSRKTPDASRQELDALLLLSCNEVSAQREEVMLMLPPGALAMDQTLIMHAFGRGYPLLPRQLGESGEGYELTRFRVQLSPVT